MGKIEDLPPSYDEAISQGPTGPSTNNTNHHQPPPHPPRPQAHPAQTSTGHSYTTHNYSTSSHSIPQNQQQVPGPRPVNNIPWQYPRGYWCSKCHNTGKKLKNGKSCQKCWDKFAPRNGSVNVNTSYNPRYGSYTIPVGNNPPFNSPGPSHFSFQQTNVQNMAPRYVRPGDPAIGGVQCGKCRGSGLVRFFLDEELCQVCHGVGRVFI